MSKKEDASPESVEMLGIFSRYEAGLMNAVIKTLTLFRGLRAERVAAATEAATIDGSKVAVVHLNKVDLSD